MMCATLKKAVHEVHLPPRLQAIANMVISCSVVYDIGTDHAWLPIFLLQRERCQMAVASDVRPGPLKRAAEHVKQAGLENRIDTRLSDGFEHLEPTDQDTVILAGLGGKTIMDILESVKARKPTLVIQAMKSLPELRTFLSCRGYRIEDEDLVCEKKQVYPVMRVRYSGDAYRLSSLETWLGPVLLQKKPFGFSLYKGKVVAALRRQARGNPELITVARQVEAIFEKDKKTNPNREDT
jgi:tRNA (adenine22-N1)-methyltransferase